MDGIRNEEIRAKMGMKRDVLQETRGHIVRIAGQVAEWNPQGKRRCNTPGTPMMGGIKNSMQSKNLKNEEYFDRELQGKKLSLG
jgi:hypothetical protein